MNKPLNIDDFLKLSQAFLVIDVRSPAEFEQGHIPGAHNIPVFDNEERAAIGTAYKQISREKAIKIGYQLANPKIKSFITQIQDIIHRQPRTWNLESETVLIHCWRGGMRSTKFAEMLNTYGYKTHTLVRGYKAYRNFVLESFKSTTNILILGGETGSGKTEILQKIREQGEQIIDLENLAHHKGSAFGSLGEKPQPTQEQFENNLALEWQKHASPLSGGEKEGGGRKVWMEDEARSIGKVQIPQALWEKMKQAPILRLNISKQLRIERLVFDYGKFSKEELKNCVLKIQQRLGGQHVKHALEELEKGNLHDVADITLAYYDKAYTYDHEKRNMKNIFFIECETADASANAQRVIEFVNTKFHQEYA